MIYYLKIVFYVMYVYVTYSVKLYKLKAESQFC